MGHSNSLKWHLRSLELKKLIENAKLSDEEYLKLGIDKIIKPVYDTKLNKIK
jgi:hypothetical protein